MKVITNIFILFLIWLICSADGCNDNVHFAEMRSQQQIETTRDSLKQVFEADSPGENLLQAYEATAKQKLTDFADYIKIASDSSINMTFRIQAGEMAGKLFNNRGADITCWNKVYPVGRTKSIDSLLNNCLANRMDFYIIPSQLKINSSLKRIDDSLYQGKLSFYPRQINFMKKEIPEKADKMLIAEFYVIKRAKHFGNEELSIWNVCLGDIKTTL